MTDPPTIRTIGRLFEDVAKVIYDLTNSLDEGPAVARDHIAKASALTALVCELIESGDGPIFPGSSKVN